MQSIKTLEELMGIQFPEQQYIVNRILPDASITILSGTSRSFKTYILLHAAISVANGTALFDQFETAQTGVLMIDEENGDRLLQKRLKQLDASPDLPIYFTHGFKLDDKTLAKTIAECQGANIRLVIIDSLIRIHGSDENSARDMAKVFKQLRQFTEHGIAVLVTQHNRKQGSFSGGAGNEMRGSTDILAAVDAHIGVVRKEKWYLHFDQTKQRFDAELEPFEVKVVAGEANFAFEYLGAAMPRVDRSKILRDTVAKILSEHEQLSQKDLLTKLEEAGAKSNEHTLRSSLARWIKEDFIAPPLSGNGNTKLYRLTNQKVKA